MLTQRSDGSGDLIKSNTAHNVTKVDIHDQGLIYKNYANNINHMRYKL